MDLETFNETKKILNKPLIANKILEKKHLIFIKYTSELYYKYSIELIETLCKKSKFANTKLLFHTTLSFLLKILYNCGNKPCLNDFDLLILCSFSIGIKSIEARNKSPSINRLKKIYQEKFYQYENDEIKIGEIICLKLMDYNINILTPYDSLFYLLYESDNLNLFDKCIQHLDNLIISGDKSFMFKAPLDIAKETIEYVIKREKEKMKFNKNYNMTHHKNRIKIENQLINNESISTNISSNNVSNIINNSIHSSNKKLTLNNKLKEISNSKKLIIDIEPNQQLEKNNDLKIILNHTYTERNNINNTIENKKGKYLYNNNITNKNLFKYQKNIYKYNDNSRYINYIKNNQNSLNKLKNEIRCKQNLIHDNNNEKKILKDKTDTSINSKSYIKSKGINFNNIQNNINFKNNKLNELCKKMNFDALEIK